MKKIFSLLVMSALALGASAQGITAVGANVVIAPSNYWDKAAYEAKTYVINSGTNYGDWNTDNPNYNVLCGEEPADDTNGKHWYDLGYDTEDEYTIGENPFTYDEIYWEDHVAPFSSDDTYNGLPSYKWTEGSIMADIYFRRSFTTTSVLPNDVYLACGHDDAPCEYYINGVLVFSKDGDPAAGNGWNNAEYVKLTAEQKALIKKDGSENILAVHVHQNWGGAYADCGLYTSVPGGVDMGYTTPWTGKTLYNRNGGYQFNGSSAFRTNGTHGWEVLYQASKDDVYTFVAPTGGDDDWQAQVHFITPIKIDPTHEYSFECTIKPQMEVEGLKLKLTDLYDDGIEGYYEDEIDLAAGEETKVEGTISGTEIQDFKVVFDFYWGQPNNVIELKGFTLTDDTTGEELWDGTSYYNYMYFVDDMGKHVKDPVIQGRVETKSWTQVDFDDTMWNDTPMPIGSSDQPNVQTLWQKGVANGNEGQDSDENTGYWIRRTFELSEINPSLEYLLSVCHDDDYETYVNGHLLQQNTGWTNGKNPAQVHIPAKYLNVGKNVIATEIHQNWGGRFYDCGINVLEFNFQEVVADLQATIDAAKAWEGDLTEAMWADYNALLAEAEERMATELDGAELRDYNKNTLKPALEKIQGYSGSVKSGREWISFAATLGAGYHGEIAAHALTTEQFEACKTPNEINTAVDGVKKAWKRTAQFRHTENYVGSPAEEGDFYIYNVGEKLFLGGGESWGAHAALEYSSNAMTLIATDVENGFVIETYRPNGNIGENDFLGYNGYVDVSAQDVWVFVPVEGKENVYNIRRNGENGENGVYLGYRGGDNQNGYSWCTVDSDLRTAELESNQWMLVSKEEMDALAEKATAENPVDMTHLIVNPGFDQRLTMDYWEAYNIWGRGGDHPDFVHENWNSDCALTYNLEDDALLPGFYTLEFNGYYREGHKETHNELLANGEEIESGAIAWAEDCEIALPLITDNDILVPGLGWNYEAVGKRLPDSCTDAAEFFEVGAYRNYGVFYTKGYELQFGIESMGGDAEGRWTVVDNFRLVYWGTEEPDPAGINNTVVNTNKATGIFNLNGQKLQKAVKGVNIINGRKVVVK